MLSQGDKRAAFCAHAFCTFPHGAAMSPCLWIMKDYRTLCPRCRADYLTAGYRLRLVPGRYKEPCDKCGRDGLTYELREPREARHDR